MVFSSERINSQGTPDPEIAYAIKAFHQFRDGAYAYEAGMNIAGVGNRTKFYFVQNARYS